MTTQLSIPRTASRGIVGDRQLLAIQTFDVARLTNHAVPLIPGTFIAVSGQGPKQDSNGSGKTSFLAAVTILMGDPQWRLDSNAGKYAVGVLFRPDSAGVDPTHDIRPASSGYIVGVFAEQDRVSDTAMTVWVRLSTSTPYMQARWGTGIQVADAETDDERFLQADGIWQGLKTNGTLSARKMAELLYGDAPRCLSYLDTPLRPAVASLLSQQMTEMAPRDIADSLIALAGSKAHIDEERDLRGTVLAQRRERDESLTQEDEQRAREQTDLDSIAGRDAARSELAGALSHWHQYTAQRYLDVLRRDGEMAERIGDLAKRHAEAAGHTAALTQKLADLESRSDLTTDEQRARAARDRACQHREGLQQDRTAKATIQAGHDAELIALRPMIDNWDGRDPDECELALELARDNHAEHKQQLKLAESAVTAAREALQRAEQGRGGDAGLIIDILHSQAIDATALFDIVELTEDTRAEWEPRLWPWRDAVIVDRDAGAAARYAVAEIPGAQLIYTDGGHAVTYAGVRCPLPIATFFRQLEQRLTPGINPVQVTDSALQASIIGDFAEALTGREALLARMRRSVAETEQTRDDMVAATEVSDAAARLADLRFQAARAAGRTRFLTVEVESLAREVESLDRRIGEAIAAESGQIKAWEESYQLLTGHNTAVQLNRTQVTLLREKERELHKNLAARQQDRQNLSIERWREVWGGDLQQATDLVSAIPADTRQPVEQVRVRAVEQLARATSLFGIDDSSAADLPADFREAAERRRTLAADSLSQPPSVGLADIAFPLRTRLDGQAGADRVLRNRIEQQRMERSRIHEDLEERLADAEQRLQVVQDMIAQRVEGVLKRVSAAFNQLDIDRGGCGAELIFDNVRPAGPGEWLWEVTPRWRRSLRGPFVSYREVANGAQVKVYAVQLVLAALLADADTSGRVLVLDELGNSLGEVNRKDVLGALKRVAERQHVTILGTCQDSVVADASDVCGALTWFTHTNTANAYNNPTRVWAFDANGERVILTAEWLTTGRHDDWP
ncbi:hypothetical protein [Nocardia sp. XZ_19_231]|uniref:hypothetical protein n=1 Tax=Nocardia sp. XZ_19_231 TaxID=2769252 RepID=UPI00188DD1D8|nr:hypothetical protein [Nocardia sp. XZ_19_231]